MLAEDVAKVFRKEGHRLILTDINKRLPDIEALDVANDAEVLRRIEEARPDYVFHLAAETNVDLCEEDPEHAYRVNVKGTGNIARACGQTGAAMLYISSGAIFDGKKDAPYTEDDKPAPVSVYGRTKLEGEYEVKGLLEKYFIVRAGWMIGGWELDKKFVYKIVRQLKEGRKELRVVSDKFGSPTFTWDFAANLMDLVKSGKFGLYHMANKGTCSRYDIAVKIVEFMGLKGKVKVTPISSDEFPLPAPRARSEMIENRNLEKLGINNMPRWEGSLARYIRENKDK